MLSKFAATVLLSIVVFIGVTLFVSLGALWWTGDGTRSVLIGVICGAVAVLTVRAVSWYGRWGERPGKDTNDLGMDGIAEQDTSLKGRDASSLESVLPTMLGHNGRRRR
jgi:Na+/proline symporter